MAEPILQVAGVSKSYPSASGPLTVLHEISFTLHPGESLALVGPSGSGKSTLLGLCAGLDQPSTGSVSIGGRVLGPMSEDQRAALRNQLVGFVFQNFQLLPTLTAVENVMIPLEIRGERNVQARALELLDKVGLLERQHHYPNQLSGGEQQRVAIARAFCARPQLMFADEPTGNLDEKTSALVQDMLFNLVQDEGAALVLVTHDPDLARRTQRQLRLRGGKVEAWTNA